MRDGTVFGRKEDEELSKQVFLLISFDSIQQPNQRHALSSLKIGQR